MPATVHAAGTDEQTQAALESLLETIERFESFAGPIHASPLYGAMDRETAERLQWVHFGHHLGFFEPSDA